MKILSEKLLNYRNITSAEFYPSDTVNVICGENGQGKTNLLESIFLLTGAKSFRHAKDLNLLKTGEQFAVIESSFEASKREQSLSLTISDKGRNAVLNHGSEVKASSLAGTLCCVVFSPDHLDLVKGTPQERRNFIDTALCQLSPEYCHELKLYTRFLMQKNAVLKDARSIGAAYDMLDTYDEGLSGPAAFIISMRKRFISDICMLSKERYAGISSDREKLEIGYLPSFPQDVVSAEDISAYLTKTRADDIRTGFSNFGPHRDDMLVALDGDSARIYGSQGQQRTAVLALKMAEADIFRKQLEEEPILLLDDVLSELDGRRQDFLIRNLGCAQSIITCCDPNYINRRTDASVFRMINGELEKI